MSALDIKLAVGRTINEIPGIRGEHLVINPHVIFLDLSCPGGKALKPQKSGYVTLTPDMAYTGAPDGAVVVHIDDQTYAEVFSDPEQEKSFAGEADKRAKRLIQEHCKAHCESGMNCRLRRKES
jgi:hypothetical protein